MEILSRTIRTIHKATSPLGNAENDLAAIKEAAKAAKPAAITGQSRPEHDPRHAMSQLSEPSANSIS